MTSSTAIRSAGDRLGREPFNLRTLLRTQTRVRHDEVDSLYGGLSISSRAGYQRFLLAHYIALSALCPATAEFVCDQLEINPPDFTGMLKRDLLALGVDAEAAPQLAGLGGLDAAGVTYVIAGSRLGLAVMRQEEYYGRDQGIASVYMEDESGLTLWRKMLGWMDRQPDDPAASANMCAAADKAFTSFQSAHAMSDVLGQD